MMNRAQQQGAAQNLGRFGKFVQEFLPGLNGALVYHL
jgi:hypothetical protein